MPTVIHTANQTTNDQALRSCAISKQLEEMGNYEEARGALIDLWKQIGQRPRVEHLGREEAATVLLRAGSLSGWLGTVRQIASAQDAAKDLLSEAIAIFDELGKVVLACEAQIDLGYCYWRQGAYDEARVFLREALAKLGERDPELSAKGTLRRIIVERTAVGHAVSFPLLREATSLFEKISNHTVKGGYHVEMAVALKDIGRHERKPDYVDRALIEYEAAGYHFEQAGHSRYRANVENNLGQLFYELRRYDEAHKHLDRAVRLFNSLKDKVHGARTDQTRACVLIAQGRHAEAERVARGAVHALIDGGEQALFCQISTTHALALAKLKRADQAQATLRRAIAVAEEVGAYEAAGRAALTMIEEIGETLSVADLQTSYETCDRLLAQSSDAATLARLRRCALTVIRTERERARRHAARSDGAASSFVGVADATRATLAHAERVAPTGRTVLICGETGTGKDLMARLVHERSGRDGKFVAVNCAALSETLFESEIFGHLRGSFTDAVDDRAGAAREAAEGTLFLDEVGELSPRNQAKLLRLVENGEVLSVGAAVPEQLNVRIIAATNKSLPQMVAEGSFRADLYYRLAVHEIKLLPLRERAEDIPVIARHLIESCAERHRKTIYWDADAVAALQKLPLPGNVRELRSLIERTVLSGADGQTITAEAVELMCLRGADHASSSRNDLADEWRGCVLGEEVRRYEGQLIERALVASGGQITRAAQLLGISHQSLSFMLEGRHQKLRAARNLAKRRKTIIHNRIPASH